ncbi:MAG: ANTAR domain-containing protein [Oscillospiraceae bacterium]|nr:ANTAR domain-containing protein [Oscillospiraceae bacterium]
MESALIVSFADKGTAYFTELLAEAAIRRITTLPSCAEARRTLLVREFDLIVVNAPLRDEPGENFARDIASRGTAQVILAVKSEYFGQVSAACEGDGVLTVSKPVNRNLFRASLSLAKSAHRMVRRVQSENARLKQKIEDIRVVDRAKWLLISRMNMSEQDAHRLIEKQAMDMRSTKRAVAEGILKTYEN